MEQTLRGEINYRIIVIEDDPQVAKLLGRQLSRYGYGVSLCQDFEHVDTVVRTENPDLVLLDINLPFYDGFYWCRRIRRFLHLLLSQRSVTTAQQRIWTTFNTGHHPQADGTMDIFRELDTRFRIHRFWNDFRPLVLQVVSIDYGSRSTITTRNSIRSAAGFCATDSSIFRSFISVRSLFGFAACDGIVADSALRGTEVSSKGAKVFGLVDCDRVDLSWSRILYGRFGKS